MTPEQWSVVNRIFHDAVELPVAQRAPFVQHESDGDLTVQTAVTALLLADESGQDYLDLPAAATPEFQHLFPQEQSPPLVTVGDVLCDRFQIVRPLGEGGMGQVYEAFDLDLQVRIAMKTIQPDIAAVEGMANRFRHEVRLARSITHPNICRTFDLERTSITGSTGERRELLFLTMEYLEGETLGARLARSGPLPLEEALDVARQMAAGIEAAHRHGVVHRDLKPQNVLLTTVHQSSIEERRVVIMDFGLARLDPASFAPAQGSSVSGQGQVAGTFAYMAPEQVAGGQATPVSDIYSFGLILFEIVTGTKAFPAEDLLQDYGRRFGDRPPSPRGVDPSVPEAWEAAVTGCLTQRPEDRFTSANQVIETLLAGGKGGERSLPPATTHRPFWTASRTLRRLLLVAAVIILAAVSSFVLGSRFRRAERKDASVPPGALIYMPPVMNQTHNPRLSQVTQMMRVALAQSSRIALLDEAQEADTLQRMVRPLDTAIDAATAREIAMRTAARRIVLVTLAEDHALLHLAVSVQQPEATTPTKPRLHLERSWTCGLPVAANEDIPPDLLHIVRDASDWVRQTAGEANEDIVNLSAPVEDLTTINWGAFMEYTRADRLQQQGRSSDAVLALTEAVRLDPGFALAYARMGDILFSIARSAEGLEAYRKALDTGEQRRLTRRERDRIRGQYAIDTWDFQTAEAVFRDATVYYERDYLSWFYRGSVLIDLDRMPEATATLRNAATLRPGGMSAPFALASALFIENDADGALQIAAQLASSGHPEAAWWLQAEDQWLRGHWEEADATLGRITAQPPSNWSTLAWPLRARMAMDRDQAKTARSLLIQGMDVDKQTGSASRFAGKQLDLAYIECAAGEYAPCFADLEASLRSEHDPKSFRAASEILSRAVRQHPPVQVQRQIQGFFHRLIDQAPGDVYGLSAEIVRDQLRSDLLLSQHKVAEAVPIYRKIAVLDPPVEANLRLARSLGRAAEMEDHPANKRALFAEAAMAYGSLDISRPYLWYHGNSFPPSFETEAKLHLKLAGTSYTVPRPQGPL